MISIPKISEEEWELKKNKIIDVAFELFFTNGYSSVSINDIVKAAKISKGGFYTYFQSKQEIFFSILKKSDDLKINLAKKLTQQMTAKEKIITYLHIRLSYFLEEDSRKWAKFSSEFWATVPRNYVIDEIFDERFRGFFSDIKSIIEEGIEIGEFNPLIDINSVIYVMMSTIDGMAFMASVANQPLTEETIETASNVFLNYLIRK